MAKVAIATGHTIQIYDLRNRCNKIFQSNKTNLIISFR